MQCLEGRDDEVTGNGVHDPTGQIVVGDREDVLGRRPVGRHRFGLVGGGHREMAARRLIGVQTVEERAPQRVVNELEDPLPGHFRRSVRLE